MTPRPLHLVILSLALALLAGCGKQTAAKTNAPAPSPSSTISASSGKVAATVNGHPILMSTYDILYTLDKTHLAGQKGVTTKLISQEALNQAIQNEVLTQYANAHHITTTQSEVNAEVNKEQTQAGGATKFQAELKQAGLTLSGYKILLLPNMISRKVANVLFPLKLTKVEAAHVWHILISQHPKSKPARTDAQAKALATSILHQVQAGGDFAGLARQYSDDPGSAQQGGDLGTIYAGQTVPSFNTAAFSAPLNKATLIKSKYGYHVLEVISRGSTAQPTQASQQAQQQQFANWIGAQTRKAKVKKYVK